MDIMVDMVVYYHTSVINTYIYTYTWSIWNIELIHWKYITQWYTGIIYTIWFISWSIGG